MNESEQSQPRGWDYFLSPNGIWIVALDRSTGRLLLVAAVPGSAPRELLIPDHADREPQRIEVLDDGRAWAFYREGTVRWEPDQRLSGPVEPEIEGTLERAHADGFRSTHLSGLPLWHRMAGRHISRFDVEVSDGRVLDLSERFDGLVASSEQSDDHCVLDPGTSQRWTLESEPMVDPSASRVVALMESTKYIDHGWLAVWDVAEIEAAMATGTDVTPTMLYPNGEPFVDEIPDHVGGARFSTITDIAFSSDGSLVYLIDHSTIHCWTWPDFDFAWRIRRPELTTRIARSRLESPVECGAVQGSHVAARVVLMDGSVIDLSLEDLSTEEAGSAFGALAVSSADGQVLTSAGQMVDPPSGIARTCTDDLLVSAREDPGGGFFTVELNGDVSRVSADGRLVPLGNVGSSDCRVLAVSSSGKSLLLSVDGEAREFEVDDKLNDTDWSASGGRHHFVISIGSGLAPFSQMRDSRKQERTVTRAVITDNGEKVVGTIWGEIHGDGWWMKGGDSAVSALASDGDTLIAGFSSGKILVWQRYRSLFDEAVFEDPVHLLLPVLAERRLLAADSAGNVALIEWS